MVCVFAYYRIRITAMSDDEYFEPLQHTTLDVAASRTMLIKMSFIDLVRYTTPWTYNRKLEQSRIDELYRSLFDNSLVVPQWMFHCVYDSAEDGCLYKIIDGGHRLEAIRRFIDDDKNYNEFHTRHVYVWLYDIPNAENSMQTVELFKKINNNFLVASDQLPDMFIVDLLETVCRHPKFKKGIVTKENTQTAHRPRIQKKELKALFMENRKLLESMTTDEILLKMDLINRELLKLNPMRLVKRSRDASKVNSAYQLEFCLNLTAFPPDRWIEFLAYDDKRIREIISGNEG